MKRLLFIGLYIVFVSNVYSQTECRLDLVDSPKLLDLKLGMSSAEADAVFGRNLKVKAKREGQSSTFKTYLKKDGKGSLKGVRALFLRFDQDVLYQIEIFYKTEYKWQTLPEFINDYSTQNNFPLELWETKYGYSKVKCKGFSLDADYILNPHIQLTDNVIEERVDKYRAEKAKENNN